LTNHSLTTATSALQIALYSSVLLISAYILVFYVRKLNQPRFHLLMFSLISLASIMLVIVGVLLLIGDGITIAAR
jgi:hypothetical protein